MTKLTNQELTAFNVIETKVISWARQNVPELYNYSSRASYWRAAQQAGVITEENLSQAYDVYGHMIDYTGD